MSERFPGGVVRKTLPTVCGPQSTPIETEGGFASGIWTLSEVANYEKAGAWPRPLIPRELYGFGFNNMGQTGTGTSGVGNDISSPTQVGALNSWSIASATYRSSGAVRNDGTLWTWGINFRGNLGHNNVTYRSSPTQVGALTNWKIVSSSNYHMAAVKTDGTLWTWGYSQAGRLGNDTSGTTNGRSSPIQIGNLTDWATVSTTVSGNAAIKTDGTLWGWGCNFVGGVGDGTTDNRSSPVQIGSLTNWYANSFAISSGNLFHIAQKTDGTLWGWGLNTYGQLGDNTNVSKSSPVQVCITDWSNFFAGRTGYHAGVVKTNGTLWMWGRNSNRQIGDGASATTHRSSPVQIGALTNWANVGGGFDHTGAVKTDGTLWTWGNNNRGELGQNNQGSDVSSPVQVGASTNWISVTGGRDHTLAFARG